jgi:glyoxylase-like metal-dependent hydrolase (beta-lactamase superfamily II)
MPAPGHTWGHQVVVWRDAQGTCCYTGDVMPTVHHAHLSASLGYDVLPYQTMLTKRALLELADRERWRLVLDHESGDCVVQRGMAG